MTLMSTLRSIPDFELAALNFSSATTPELLLSTFDQCCEYRRTPTGTVLRPLQAGKWLVVFCDEVNLPAQDAYGTQRVISFLRQLTEQGGFWRFKAGLKTWVTLERIQVRTGVRGMGTGTGVAMLLMESRSGVCHVGRCRAPSFT